MQNGQGPSAAGGGGGGVATIQVSEGAFSPPHPPHQQQQHLPNGTAHANGSAAAPPPPAIRINAAVSNVASTGARSATGGPPSPRQRQTYQAPPTTPGTKTFTSSPYHDEKDTQLVSPPYDSSNPYGNAPPSHISRARSPLSNQSNHPYLHQQNKAYQNNDPPLSTFLHSIFKASSKHATSYLTPSSSDVSLPYLNSFLGNGNEKDSRDSSSPVSTGQSTASQGGATGGAAALASSAAAVSLKVPTQGTVGFIALCGLWYLSSALSSNTGKSIMTRFRYPVTLTFIQFFFVAGYCVLFLFVREQWSQRFGNGVGGAGGHALSGHGHGHGGRRGSLGTAAGWGIKKPSRNIFQGTLMMSLFQIAGHVFSSMAIARVPVSTVHTIKALSPLFTVLSYAVLFRVRYSPPTYIALVPLTSGVMLACSSSFRANAAGLICALGSTLIFVSQNIFSKKLLPKDGVPTQSAAAALSPAKLDKLNLLFYSSGMAFFLMIPIWLYTDASTLLNLLMTPTSDPSAPSETGTLVFFFLLNGSVHFLQNLIAFSILARTSPVTYSIASLVKRIAVICLAIVWSGQKVTLSQGFGMTMTFVGLAMYNRAKQDVDKGERKRAKKEDQREGGSFLPTTMEDLRHGESSSSGPTEVVTPEVLRSHGDSNGAAMGPISRKQSQGFSVGGGGGGAGNGGGGFVVSSVR